MSLWSCGRKQAPCGELQQRDQRPKLTQTPHTDPRVAKLRKAIRIEGYGDSENLRVGNAAYRQKDLEQGSE